jgi:hypothetical protein
MKKNIIFILFTLFIFSCGTQKSTTKEGLYEILSQQNEGGAQIKFYEILSEEKEINMLLSDENLKNKIKPSDIKTSNFAIINLGEKSTSGYSISVEKVTELSDRISIKIKENTPKTNENVMDVISYPFAILKINSKKPIFFD